MNILHTESSPDIGGQELQACHDAGIEVRLQINESHAPEEGCISGTEQVDQTEAWFRQLGS
ncbi:hypothetical protein KMF66_004856, partial [Salmonella enterica]|nr:hypothetical protein [Salmonella enterica]